MSGHTVTKDDIRTAFTVFYDAPALIIGFDPDEVQITRKAISAIFRAFPDDYKAANKEINILIGATVDGRTVEDQRVYIEAWFQAEFDRISNR